MGYLITCVLMLVTNESTGLNVIVLYSAVQQRGASAKTDHITELPTGYGGSASLP